MEKRLLLAVVLMTAAIMFTNLLFPPPEPPAEVEDVADVADPAAPRLPAVMPAPGVPQATAAVDSVVVETERVRYTFGTRGAALLNAYLLGYPSYTTPAEPVQLVPAGVTDFLAYRLVVGVDTVDLRSLPFSASTRRLTVAEGAAPAVLDFEYSDENGFSVGLRYSFSPDSYLFSVTGQITGLNGRRTQVVTNLGPGFDLHEHPDHHAEREFAVVTRVPGSVDRLPFRRVDGRQVADAALTWAGIKDKYFLAAVIGGERALSGAIITAFPEERRVVDRRELVLPRAQVSPLIPMEGDGSFAFDVYAGPQEYGVLAGIGYDLEEVTPYGYRWLQPVIRPLAAAILWVLNALHSSLGIAYGWVLVIFGVMMRVVLWPLNAKAMRAQMRNMAAQPLLQEIREKHGDDPKKQQEAMVALYKEHGFNPFAGCLPLLVPMPVLITLFFVFQNTIAFRGAEFLWLPDLSLRDPLYILPIILVVSMFALQWVMARMSGIEQNPQMQMMMYVLPIVMGVIFFMLPSGLNLYYAVTQVASIPQQVLIAKERRKAQEELKQQKAAAPKPLPKPRVAKGRKKGRR